VLQLIGRTPLLSLSQEEGILVGPSAGAALAASLQVARALSATVRKTPAVVVTIFPDSGARYVAGDPRN
jgi:cysteine synthase